MKSLLLPLAGLLAVVAGNVNAVSIGQIQTFDEPSYQWLIGDGPRSASPSQVPTALGGPGGPADPYLALVAKGGDGPGSRLGSTNHGEWAGDYIDAGVNRITLDLNNFGPETLFVRLLFVQFDPEPVSVAFTEAMLIPAGSGWRHVEFDISPSALIPIPRPFLPIDDPAVTLAHAGELRIFHNPAPFFAPAQLPAVTASLGVDNITAAAVPEPAAGTLATSGAVMFALLHLKRSRVQADKVSSESLGRTDNPRQNL